MALNNLFKTLKDPTLGFADSKTAQSLSENLNLGHVADNMNVNGISDKIKASNIANVIKYEGNNDTFIWKHPVEDFNIGSQLIVHESQEAIFYMNGEALDLFGPGRHTLHTQNLPIIGKLFSAAMGGETPFHCDVYFINKTEQLALKWGTDSKLEYVEPTYGFPIQIGASGEMSLRVADSRKLLVKVVGTERGITNDAFIKKMRAFLVTRIKTYLASLIKREKINIFEIDEHLMSLSETLQSYFADDFAEYGVSMEHFFVTSIVKPEDSPQYKKFKEIHFRQYADVAEARLRQQTQLIDQDTQRQKMILESQGMAAKRQIEGYTYQDERGFDVAERTASNEAVGQFTNMGIGMGIMSGVGGAIGGVMSDKMTGALNPVVAAPIPVTPTAPVSPPAAPATSAKIPCTSCGAEISATAKFCAKCGQKNQPPQPKNLFCSECGVALIEGAIFCEECGTKVEVS